MVINRFALISIIGVATLGCGGVVETKIKAEPNAIESSVRRTLEDYEKTGKLGSSLTSLESDINGIKSSDSTKGEALSKDYRELQQLKDPAKIKAKAKEMLGKL